MNAYLIARQISKCHFIRPEDNCVFILELKFTIICSVLFIIYYFLVYWMLCLLLLFILLNLLLLLLLEI